VKQPAIAERYSDYRIKQLRFVLFVLRYKKADAVEEQKKGLDPIAAAPDVSWIVECDFLCHRQRRSRRPANIIDYLGVRTHALHSRASYPAQALNADTDKDWNRFVTAFRAEMNAPAARRTLDLLAALSHRADFSLGCYCEDEGRCHRSVLRALLAERNAAIA
jgi:hypothetical protein